MPEKKLFKAVPFDGTDEAFPDWEFQVMAYSASYGFQRFLVQDIAVLSAEKIYELDTTSKDYKMYEANANAFVFLLQSCGGTSKRIVQRSKTADKPFGDPYLAWKNLKQRYKGRDVGTDLVRLKKKFNDCRLSNFANPELWYTELANINDMIREVSESYANDDTCMKAYILTQLPRDYEAVKARHNNALDNISIDDFMKDISDCWKRNQDNTSVDESDSHISINNVSSGEKKKKKPTVKNVKGQEINALRNKGKRDLSTIRCYNCQKFGHYKTKCPLLKRKKEGTEDKEGKEPGMFTGYFQFYHDGSALCKETEENCDEFGRIGSFNAKKDVMSAAEKIVSGNIPSSFFDSFGCCDGPLESEKVIHDEACDDWVQEETQSRPVWILDKEEDTLTSEDDEKEELRDNQEEILNDINQFVGVVTENLFDISEEAPSLNNDGVEQWLLDTGATCHVTNNCTLMQDMRPA
jgi:hypothetical protein